MYYAQIQKHCRSKYAKAAVCVMAVCGVGTLIINWKKRRILRKKAEDHCQRETSAIQKKLQELENENEEEIERIISMESKALINAGLHGDVTPIQVLNAYLYKACFVNKRLNCVTGLIKDADVVALGLKPNQKHKLYGLPVSLKESLQIKGMDSTLGLAKNIGDPAKDDCVLAKVLKHCGAIPFVKTNLTQMTLTFDSSNPIFGSTSNPHNEEFSPGGSSSGEGALIAAGGSLLGFGTDTGGSIRCPAHMCGICGFKPSLNRISSKGLKGLPGIVGPMSRDVDTLVLAMRALLCPLMFELDVDVPPLPFNEEIFSSKKSLRIGFYVDDNFLAPVPAVKRAVTIAQEALEREGHVLIPFEVPQAAYAMNIWTAGAYSDGGRLILDDLKYDRVDPILQRQYGKLKAGRLWRKLKCSILGIKWPRLSQDLYIHGGGDGSVTRLRNLQAEAHKYKEEFLSAWRDKKLDAVICPPFPVVAGQKGSFTNISGMRSYTGLYNFLNYPAGVIPVTEVKKDDIDKLQYYKGHYDDPWDEHIKMISLDSLGMPVGVQCVALPYNDEICLRVMKEVETLLGSVVSS